jgi:hypothetical protein
MKNALALAALASCLTAESRAATAPPVPENLQACSKLADTGERVRCYDTEIAKMNAAAASGSAPGRAAPTAPVTAASPAAPTSPADSTKPAAARAASPGTATPSVAAPAPPSAPQSAAAKFGAETLPSTARPAPRPEEEMALLSSITAMRAVGQQKYAISLANGQIWRQEEASPISMFFRVGDSVRIQKGALGSYHMSTDTTGTKNWVRVTRVQ